MILLRRPDVNNELSLDCVQRRFIWPKYTYVPFMYMYMYIMRDLRNMAHAHDMYKYQWTSTVPVE